MADFMIRFLICNVFISGIIGILLIIKRIFKNILSCRMQYNLWFLLLGLLAVPFIPFRFIDFSRIILWFDKLRNTHTTNSGNVIGEVIETTPTVTVDWMNDFTLSINNKTPIFVGHILLVIWLVGILAMIILVIKSSLRLSSLKRSALPLQSAEVHKLYCHCLKKLKIHKDIPIYSTAFLKSPIIVGLFKPRIYLPIHLISDYNESDMQYMLLHELQHYKHKDAFASYFMNLAGVIYWFNPFVWYSLKEMRNDREIACDSSVLKILDENSYTDYGNTLINFAEKISLTPFPFATGLSGNLKQMKRRIINIASYEKPTFRKKTQSTVAFILTATLLMGTAPFLSTYAANHNYYQWDTSSKNISYEDFSTHFGKYKGSFVLYDLQNDSWSIYDMERATLQVAPNSTYKIYIALFGLETGIITPEDSLIKWDRINYPFESWNADQTLESAMSSSVNWYFQTIDKQLGSTRTYNYIQKIGYGNENIISGDLSSYWMSSSLQIPPIEQVELLTKLQSNHFEFAPENIKAVKDSLCLSTSDTGTFYGKTGTDRINEQDVNGWFVGLVETKDNTYFFATNIESDSDATGIKASEITLSILSDMNIWK